LYKKELRIKMAYQFLRKNLAMDKFIVQEILNYMPEKEMIYTFKTCDRCGDTGEYIPVYREVDVPQSEYYHAIFSDCMGEIYKKNKPVVDSDDEDSELDDY